MRPMMMLRSQWLGCVARGVIDDISFSSGLTRARAPAPLSLFPYITGGTVMPITASVRISSRRTTATVASRNCFRFSSGSLRMGWR
jgi:hypothetical protein